MLLSQSTRSDRQVPTSRFARLLTMVCCILTVAICTAPSARAEDFAEMDLEALMNVEVSSVTKGKGMKLSDAPGAISVISQEDIARTGHQSIPELLRLVPGLDVARLDSNRWAISARGFNGVYNNKMLVLMDGRSLYTPLFSGVFWDAQDTVMEDLKSVEVIRGPGGTLWGANAVNGVINITTKEARDTQGVLFSTSGGNEDLTNTSVRYGGKFNDNSYFRVYGKYQQTDDTKIVGTNNDNSDEWARGQVGFRSDTYTDSNHLTVQGDWYNGKEDNRNGSIDLFRGGNVLARLKHDFSSDSNLQLQFYYDFTGRQTETTQDTEQNTLDFDMQHNFVLAKGQNLVWGLNYHWTKDANNPTIMAGPIPLIDLNPKADAKHTFSAFVQDEITLVPDKLFCTLGTKIEHNDYTGFEVQPSVRMSWRVKEGQTFWGAISRAVRTPSRVEAEMLAPAIGLNGNNNLKSTAVMAYEAGYRINLTKKLSLDMATYFNKYENQITQDLSAGTWTNDDTSEAYGFEASATWQLADNLKLIGNYTFQDVQSHGPYSNANEGTTPRNQFSARAYYDLNKKFSVNTALYWYDNSSANNVPAFFRYDLGFTWKPKSNIEVSVWGQNLADNSHQEYNDSIGLGNPIGEIQRAVYGKVTFKF